LARLIHLASTSRCSRPHLRASRLGAAFIITIAAAR
jgi:hypothetical protein